MVGRRGGGWRSSREEMNVFGSHGKGDSSTISQSTSDSTESRHLRDERAVMATMQTGATRNHGPLK